jgi:two-component system NtrC family sensor kinase
VHLIENATRAMEGVSGERTLAIQVAQEAGLHVVRVRDRGCGIATDQLGQVFAHGFTTPAGGLGFGLHSCALAAREMGGALEVHSDGPGTGATFTLTLPHRD